MSRQFGAWIVLCAAGACVAGVGGWYTSRPATTSSVPEEELVTLAEANESPVTRPESVPGKADRSLEHQFSSRVQPFLSRYCFRCHGEKKQKAALDLSRDSTVSAIVGNPQRWQMVLERLEAKEMPPEDARQPAAEERAAVVAWIRDLREREATRNAGDPGVVLARRLSNAELDYTIRDLTGVDIRPSREFPVDPANEAGFDNSGESLAMSPELLNKYLAAMRRVADHVVLKPDGFVFAPYPAVTDTDRDKYCVQRILAFYQRHQVDLADYFLAAWKYRQRAALGMPDAELSQFAAEAGLSAKYLAQVWSALTEAELDEGPLAAIREEWSKKSSHLFSHSSDRSEFRSTANLVTRLRRQLKSVVNKVKAPGISPGSQPLVLWHNRQLASRHRSYGGDVFADLRKLHDEVTSTDPALAKCLVPSETDEKSERRLRGALARFCDLFPDTFVVIDRGPYFNPKAAGQGRPLTAGFHLMQGYFRDDRPLCELILDEKQRREIDGLWDELNFIALAPIRQYKDFIFFERAEPPRFMREAEFDFARSEDKDATSQAKMDRLARVYLARARAKGAPPDALEAIETYFAGISAGIRKVERTRIAAEPGHLEALLAFAARAYRRALSASEKEDVLAFYRKLRDKEQLGHEEALRDTLTSVLLSPHSCYRLDLPSPRPRPLSPGGQGRRNVQPLSQYALASRLSYFLWSSMPDLELLARAAAGELHSPEVLKAQVKRMMGDPRIRGLATEFAGNWLDFRRFEEHNSVDRERFPRFTNELRQAMFEEPIRYFVDLGQRNRSVLDLLYGNDTFVNPVLARHYGMAFTSRRSSRSTGVSPVKEATDGTPVLRKQSGQDEWVHVEDAGRHGRGGLLPMAVFLTKNAPGLRTSPVKRGYWVVRRVLGERIPPPPPTVPELPKDEAKLGELTLPQVLARHRQDPACAGCHRRFDSIGLAFEGFGPIGERRTKDLGGRPVQTIAAFPDGKDREELAGLRAYLRDRRENDFIDNLCRKLLSYALGRSLMLSDDRTLQELRRRLEADGYRLGSLVEKIVTSRQFLNRRGRDDVGGP
jgi:hypothetical protein